VRRNPLVVDVAIAVAIAALVLIIEPGLAVAAILALVLLAVVALGWALRHRPRRAARIPRRPGSGLRRGPGRP
jgi:uncharacterized protein (DUF58 family)